MEIFAHVIALADTNAKIKKKREKCNVLGKREEKSIFVNIYWVSLVYQVGKKIIGTFTNSLFSEFLRYYNCSMITKW